MRLLRRVIVFSGVAAIVLLIAVIVAYFTALRPYAHYRVESLLRDLGFAKSSFDIQQVSLDGITLANVSLGDPEAGRIGAARVTYSLGSLWDGRVHAVKLANVQWRVQVRDGVIETGFKPADGRTDRALDMPFDRLDLQSLKLTVENESGAHGFAVDGNMVRTAAGRFDADVQIASASGPAVRLGEVSVAGITGQLHVQARSDASQLTIALREDSMLAVDSLSVQTGDASIQSSPIRFQFVPSIQPTLRITGKGANQETSINLHAASASPVTVDSPHARAFVPELSIGMTATLRENQPATVSADVILSHASVKSEAAQFLASGVDAIVPIDINGPVRRGPVAVRSVMWRDKSLPAVAATIAVTSRHLEFDAAWTPLTGAAMSAAGSLDFSGPSPRGRRACQ